MASLLTILVLDHDPAAALKVLGGEREIVVPLPSVAALRQVVERLPCDVWLCDLAAPELDFRADLARVRKASPQVRVVLTGPAALSGQAAVLVAQGAAGAFVAKPWNLLALRQAVLRLPAGAAKSLPARPSVTLRARPAPRAAAPTRPAARPRPAAGAAPAPLPPDDAHRYRLDELIGEGGVGKVFRAYDLLLDMEVAVKILRSDFIRDPDVLRALKNEAKLCMQLTHPHIVRFYDVGRREGAFFLVMEYVRGQTLYEAMRHPRSRDREFARALGKAVGSALSYAHSHGVLHNDLTPGNIIIGSSGVLKLIDFGIASLVTQRRERQEFVFGTPAYMSPEQLRCDPVLAATTDVFALGVLLFQLLTGRLPQKPDATNRDLALLPRPPVTGVAPAVAEVLDRALSYEPDRRWPSVAELVTAFDSALEA